MMITAIPEPMDRTAARTDRTEARTDIRARTVIPATTTTVTHITPAGTGFTIHSFTDMADPLSAALGLVSMTTALAAGAAFVIATATSASSAVAAAAGADLVPA